MRRFGAQVERSVADQHWKLSAGVLSSAAGRMESAAVAFNAARQRALVAQPSPRISKQVNATLLGVERQLTRPQGLVTRPWFRNLVYASDENNGYSTMVFPSVNEAIRLGNETTVELEIADLVKRFDAATKVLQTATALLQGS